MTNKYKFAIDLAKIYVKYSRSKYRDDKIENTIREALIAVKDSLNYGELIVYTKWAKTFYNGEW